MSRDDIDVPPELRDALDEHRRDGKPASDLEAVWALLGRTAPPEADLPDADDTWDGVRRHIEASAASGQERDRRAGDRRPARARSSARQSIVGWASAVAVVVVLAAVAWWWTQPIELSTAPGTTLSRTLPDGSVVELNAATRLTYPRSFAAVSPLESDRRLVRLRGEAYFEVKDGPRPFVVQTATAQVEVVGTSFSVRSRSAEESGTHVALASGRLRVTGRAAADTEVTLEPGQAVTVGPDGPLAAVRDTSLDRVTAWRRGGFAVTAQPLPVLARALERRFGRSVRLDPSIPASVRSAPLTLYYSQPVGPEQILHDVCLARNLTYRATATGFVLSSADTSQVPRSP